MSEGINNLPPLPPDAHAESRGQDEESDHFKRRVEQPVVKLNLHNSPKEENVFATLSAERIVTIRDIVTKIPQLNTLYCSYRSAEEKMGRTPLRSNLLAQVEATLRKGGKEDIERAELMLYDSDDIVINSQSVSGLKPIINSIPDLKALQVQIHHELIASKKKTGLAQLFGGQIAITNIELVTSLVEHLRGQTDRNSKAFLRILSYYSQKQKPR